MSKKDFKVYVCFTGVLITIIMFLVGIMPICVYASEGSGVNNNYAWGQESAKIFEAQQNINT